MKTIGFYGDSFCANLENNHSKLNNYETYIKKLSKGSDILSLGVGGSSVWDVVLLQFQESNIPDVSVFVWTEADRLFHRHHRNLNIMSIDSSDFKKSNPELHSASLGYYRHLYDAEKQRLECISLLHYFDKQILSKYKDKKFIHMWSFKDSINYRWENGVEIRPALIELSVLNSDDVPRHDTRPNHISGEEKNNLLYNTILDAINNYEDGRLINFNPRGTSND